MERQLTVDPSALLAQPVQLAVLPGVYHYTISLSSGDVTCQFNYYAALLPGQARELYEPFREGNVDPITPELVAGFKPADVSVRALVSRDVVSCGEAHPTFGTHPALHGNDARAAYYANSIVYDMRAFAGMSPTLALAVTFPDHSVRYLGLRLDEPNSPTNAEPTFRRFDLTKPILDAAKRQPPGSFVCE